MATHEAHLRKITIIWWLFHTRWIAVTTILGFLLLTGAIHDTALPYPLGLLVGIPLFFYAVTAVVLFWLRPSNHGHVHERGLRMVSNAVLPIDLILFTIIYIATGGIVGWGRLLFIYVPLLAIILFDHTYQVVFWGGITTALVAILALLESASLLVVAQTPMHTLLLTHPDTVWLDVGSYFAVLIGVVGISALASRGFRESEEVAHREFAMFTRALENLPDAVLLWSKSRGVTFMNQKAEELFNVHRDQVLDRPIEQLIAHETARLRAALLVKVTEEESGKVRYTIPDNDKERTFFVSRMPLNLRKGYGSELRIFREITHEEAVSKLKNKFMSVAAHQLRTPISGLKWVIQMLLAGEAGPITDMQREFLGRAGQTAERMIHLIDDLLDVTRIEEGRFAYNFEVQPNITNLVEDIVNQFKEQAAEKGITLTLHHEDDVIPPLLIDPSRLTIAIENIVSNAFKYTLKGSITASVLRRDKDVAIVVSDTGVGIPKEEFGKLFAKFYRGRNVVEKGIDGTGLGLFITKAIMERHGGDISVVSEENKGTTFTLTLPIDPSRVPAGNVPIDEAVV